MHGLETIHQLNELAALNAPGAAEKAIRDAEASREGKETNLDKALRERNGRVISDDARASAIARLDAQTDSQLVSLVDALIRPTTLEVVLARHLSRNKPTCATTD